MKILTSFLSALILISIPANAQEEKVRDLLKEVQVTEDSLSGDWVLSTGGLSVGQDKAARIVVARDLPTDYQVDAEFTRTGGVDSLALILPVGDSSIALELSAWAGIGHGISRVKGASVKDPANPTTVRPGSLENKKRHALRVVVAHGGENVSIEAALNGKPLIDWSGPLSELAPNIALNMPEPRSLGLAVCKSEAVFHKVVLRTGVKSEPDMPSVSKGSILVPFNGASLVSSEEKGRIVLSSRPEVGRGDRGAFFPSEEFSEGTIEIDLKGASQAGGSFVGVVFRAEDGVSYEAVYFRPFNFGHSDPVKRGHAVQYICHPELPWQKLRQDRPEEFENSVSPEPKSNEWFRVRVVAKDGRVKVFVNGAEEPSLDVASLGSAKAGKVGLWFNGVASFSNWKISPR